MAKTRRHKAIRNFFSMTDSVLCLPGTVKYVLECYYVNLRDKGYLPIFRTFSPRLTIAHVKGNQGWCSVHVQIMFSVLIFVEKN